MTLEQCEELLRRDTAACSRFYRKIRSEVKTMEVRESEHRWMIRRALADGPKTAMEASNWARQQGDQHMDRPLAESILRNLIKEEEVGVDVTVNAGKPPVFVATPRMKQPTPAVTARPMENPLASPAAPSTPGCPKCGGLMFDGSKTCRRCYETPVPPAVPAPEPAAALSGLSVSEIILLCADDQIGQRRTVIVAGDTRNAAQNLRTSLNTRVNTRSWKWSVHVVKARVLSVMKVGMRDEPTVERTAPIETPAPRVEPILATEAEVERAGETIRVRGMAVPTCAPAAPPAFTPTQYEIGPVPILPQPASAVSPAAGKSWATGRAALAEVDSRIAKLIEMRGALLRVIPMMETGGV